MEDTQTQNQTNEANAQPSAATASAPGPLAGDRGDAKAQPSGYRGNNPATAGSGGTHVASATPDNTGQQLNPSAPANTGTTPGTNAKIG